MEYVNGEIAIADAWNGSINFYNPLTGAFNRSYASTGGLVEGLAWDGRYLWELDSTALIARDVNSGAFIRSINNVAIGEPFDGTGLTALGGGRLAIGASTGNWFVVSDADGSLLTSGNNNLDMYGLKSLNAVPEPASMLLLGAGIAGLATRRFKKRNS